MGLDAPTQRAVDVISHDAFMQAIAEMEADVARMEAEPASHECRGADSGAAGLSNAGVGNREDRGQARPPWGDYSPRACSVGLGNADHGPDCGPLMAVRRVLPALEARQGRFDVLGFGWQREAHRSRRWPVRPARHGRPEPVRRSGETADRTLPAVCVASLNHLNNRVGDQSRMLGDVTDGAPFGE